MNINCNENMDERNLKMSDVHLKESEIEKLALTRISNPTEEIIPHENLGLCELCKQKYNYFLDFYSDLEKELNQHENINLLSKVERILNPKIIQLDYYNPHVEAQSFINGKGSLVLAAKTQEESFTRFSKAAVYSSKDGEVMIRIIKDAQQNKFRLFVLSTLKSISKYIVQVLSKDKTSLLVSVDESGKGEFELNEDIDWLNSKIVIKSIEL